MSKCSECVHCIWDGEYYDTGHIAYDSWCCGIENEFSEIEQKNYEQVYDNANYPDINIGCGRFLLDFWKSEFAQEVDGSDESYKIAMDKWEQKYCKRSA